jgi:hypothetical protein
MFGKKIFHNFEIIYTFILNFSLFFFFWCIFRTNKEERNIIGKFNKSRTMGKVLNALQVQGFLCLLVLCLASAAPYSSEYFLTVEFDSWKYFCYVPPKRVTLPLLMLFEPP